MTIRDEIENIALIGGQDIVRESPARFYLTKEGSEKLFSHIRALVEKMKGDMPGWVINDESDHIWEAALDSLLEELE